LKQARFAKLNRAILVVFLPELQLSDDFSTGSQPQGEIMRTRWFLGIVLAILATPMARAGVIVLPNSNTTVNGNAAQLYPLGDGDRTFQWVYSASQLSSIAGDEIASIGFRRQKGGATVTTPLVFTAWNLQVGNSLNPPGSLSSTFAANEAPNTVTVRSGPLTIPANSIIGGAGPNPFFDISFTKPFTYTGGDLLFTLSLSGNTNGVFVDANTLPNPVTDTVAAFGFNASSGQAHTLNSPITQLNFATVVPEPASFTLLGIGLAGLAGYGWRRRKA
jgi:hypothetical protein